MRTLIITALALGCAAESGTSAAVSDTSADVATTDATAPGGDTTADDASGAQADASSEPADAADASDGGDQDTTPAPSSELDQFILAAMDEGHLPGVAVAIIQKDQVLFSRGYGDADRDGPKPVTVDTPFMLASVSKTVIAAAVLQAADAGLLDLDQDIDTYLPFPVDHPAKPDAPITLRALLTHTAGIADDWDRLSALYVDGDSPITLAQFMQDYLSAGGAYHDATTCFTTEAPGTAYSYSNVGASLAAYVVEVATSVPFDVWCNTHLFEPLGMTNTGWHLADLDPASIALPYAWAADTGYDTYGHYGYPDYPDGALRSSVADLAKFLGMVAAGGIAGGQSILPEWAVTAMLSPAVPEIDATQGLIWYAYDDGEELYWGHEGGDSGATTTMFFRPSDGVGVIVLANGDGPADETTPSAVIEIEQRLYEEADALVSSPTP
jgi:CubicO group peptidase (beta-lactamase class C family)